MLERKHARYIYRTSGDLLTCTDTLSPGFKPKFENPFAYWED
jgi:hypothetical protein